MIDHIKVKVINQDPEVFLNNPKLDFKEMVSANTVDNSKNLLAEYKGMKFIIYVSGTIMVQGSLNKFLNDGTHNQHDLYRLELTAAIRKLLQFMKVSDRNCTLVNLEVGANVIPPIPAKELLNYLILHLRKEFKFDEANKVPCKQASFREYLINAYDKSKVYNLPHELFRFEMQFITSRKIKNLGIANISDLMEPEKLERLANCLLETWQGMLIYEPSVFQEYQYYIEEKHKKWVDPIYWINLANDKNTYRNKLSREIKTYKQLYCSSSLQEQVAKLIYEKLVELFQPNLSDENN